MKKKDEEDIEKAIKKLNEKLKSWSKIVKIGVIIISILALIAIAITFSSCEKKELAPENTGYSVQWTVSNIDKNTRIEYSRILQNNCNYSVITYEPINNQDWSLAQAILKCPNPRYFAQITSGTGLINAKVFITSKGNKIVKELIYEVNGVKNFSWQR
jgi:hypothetical protein